MDDANASGKTGFEEKKKEKRNDGNRDAVRSGGRAPISSALTDAEPLPRSINRIWTKMVGSRGKKDR